MTDTGRALLGASIPQKKQESETQYGNFDVYCFICFTPYCNEDMSGMIADNFRNRWSNSIFYTGNIYQLPWASEQKLFFEKTKWVNDQCGKHKGSIYLLREETVSIYCSKDADDSCVTLAKNRIAKIIQGLTGRFINDYPIRTAPSLTLHLLVYCFPETERYVDSFLPSTETMGSLSALAFSSGVDLQVEYVQLLTTQIPYQQMDGRIENLLDELSRAEVTDICNIYEAYYHTWSENTHSYYEESQEKCNKVSLYSISLTLAANVGGILFVPSAPALVLAAVVLDIISQGASFISAMDKTGDGFTYIADSWVFNDNKALNLKKGFVIMSTALFEFFQQGAIKLGKDIMIKNIMNPKIAELGENGVDLFSWGLVYYEEKKIEEVFFGNTDIAKANTIIKPTKTKSNIPGTHSGEKKPMTK